MTVNQLRRIAAAALAVGVVLAAGLAAPASSDARLSVRNEFGNAQADTTYSTTVTVSGSGYQSIKGAFGGVYVFFGTVSSGWRPSKGGESGKDYRYVPDSETKGNAGFQRFVAFPGSSTQGEAHAVMSSDGSWSVDLTIPGPTFQAQGRDGSAVTVDCRKATCGVFTIGAHGVKNANNETFTAVTFSDIFSSAPATPGAQTDDDGGDQTAAGTASPEPVASPDDEVPLPPAGVGVDQATAVVGRVMAFTGQGFAVGEQVVGSLDAGLAGVGPLVAGSQGEVAGVLQLPADLRAGTHLLTLTGAASGQRAEVEFQVAAAPALPSAATDEVAPAGPSPAWIAVGAAALLLVVVVVAGLVTSVRQRRAARAAAVPEVAAVPGMPLDETVEMTPVDA